MSLEKLKETVDSMDPEEALAALAQAVRSLLPLFSQEARLHFVANLLGESEDDKVASLVHLWLATCMGEGVDPTEMCQNLVSKVKRSQELVAEAHPELILLFEEWLETLEEELLSLLREKPSLGAEEVALRLGLSPAGAGFLLEKLRSAKTH